MTDQIQINDLRALTIVGALPHEQEAPQPLRIDLTLEADLHDAGITDELGDTADYGAVAVTAVAVVEEAKDVLLERLAARIAEVVLGFPRIEAVEVTLTKLRPPIPVPVGTTAVRIHRTRAESEVDSLVSHRAFIALGSNLGERESYLRAGVRGFDNVVMSQVYETAPVGGPDDQGPFLNMVVEVETSLDPFALLRRCQRIEALAMRQRVVRWGPRTLDVDIVQFDDMVIESPELTLPHPRFAERRFVLEPLAEIAPDRCPAGWAERVINDGVHLRGPLELSL
jgi:dihydroneopterin aldolase/2-amino-4-hydroxy-6-hydroxymethyldihydropteridine diphosphokinase